jgi:hypothetical protein
MYLFGRFNCCQLVYMRSFKTETTLNSYKSANYIQKNNQIQNAEMIFRFNSETKHLKTKL